MNLSTSPNDTTPEYRIEGICCRTPGVGALSHAIAHLQGLRHHLGEIGRPAEAAVARNILDLLIESRVCRHAGYVERVR